MNIHAVADFGPEPPAWGVSLTCPCGGFSFVMSNDPGRLAEERAQFEAEHANCVIDVESYEVKGELEP